MYLPSKKDRRAFLRKALESFDYARMRGGGDCEDLALEIVLEAAELLELASSSSTLSASIRSMIALRRQYVFCMALGGVSSAEINGDYGKCEEMGAHMWSMMIPRWLWRHWWRRGNLSAEADQRFFSNDPPKPAVLSDANSRPLVLEGNLLQFICSLALISVLSRHWISASRTRVRRHGRTNGITRRTLPKVV